MKLTDIIRICVEPQSGYEMEPNEIYPNGRWTFNDNDGNYYTKGLVKDIIGINIRMRPQEPSKYTINVFPNNDSWGNVIGGGDYEPDSIQTIEAIPAEGYRFAQWQDGITNNPRNIQINGNMNYIANFELEQITYDITVGVKSGQSLMGTVSGGGTGLVPDSDVLIEANANPGYRFVRWNDGNTNSSRRVPVTGDKNYIAEFEIIMYNIQAISNDPTMGTVSGGGMVNEGDSVSINANAKSGYRFIRWADGDTSNPRTIIATQDNIYVAFFEIIPPTTANITVRSDNNDRGYTYPSGTNTYNIGDEITIRAISNPDFIFTQWDDGDTHWERIIPVTGNITYTAIFEPDERENYYVGVSCNPEEGGRVIGGGVYSEGSTCTLTTVPNDGYRFVSWEKDGDIITDERLVFKVNGNVECVANFELIGYDVSANCEPNGGGTVEIIPASGPYYHGSTCTLIATPNDGYFFDQWMIGDEPVAGGVGNEISFIVNNDVVYTAVFMESNDHDNPE